MTPLAIETVVLDRLKPDPLNPRDMPPQSMADLQRSLRQFGFVQPIVARRSDRLVIGGHQRLKAAEAEGYTEVPVLWWEGNDSEARALNLALNKISGDWDEKQLASLLAELAGVESLQEALIGFDDTWTSLAGFSDREVLEALDGELGHTQDEDLLSLARTLTGPADSSVGVGVGDLFQLGPHRLLCGDAQNPETLACLCGDGQPELLFTDPPYNVRYSPEARTGKPASSGRGGGRKQQPLGEIINDDLDPAAYQELISGSLRNAAAVLGPGSPVYVCGGTTTTSVYDAAFEANAITKSSILIWDKGEITLGRKDYQSQFELIYYGWTAGKAHPFFGGRAQSDIWLIPRDPGAAYIHPTQKPVALAARAIKNSTTAGATVLDLFGGSGSTLIAAEQLGRQARVLELDPHFAALIIARWQALTGLNAEKVEGLP